MSGEDFNPPILIDQVNVNDNDLSTADELQTNFKYHAEKNMATLYANALYKLSGGNANNSEVEKMVMSSVSVINNSIKELYQGFIKLEDDQKKNVDVKNIYLFSLNLLTIFPIKILQYMISLLNPTIDLIEKIKNNSDVVRDINAKSEHIKIVKQGVKMKMSYLLGFKEQYEEANNNKKMLGIVDENVRLLQAFFESRCFEVKIILDNELETLVREDLQIGVEETKGHNDEQPEKVEPPLERLNAEEDEPTQPPLGVLNASADADADNVLGADVEDLNINQDVLDSIMKCFGAQPSS